MARTYLDDDFLLFSETARKLFHDTAKNLPIIDYHTHLPPDEVATNQRWENITDLWLGHDHYKWRAMRANGIPESHITGKRFSQRKISCLGRDHSEQPSQPPLRLDSPRAPPLFRYRYSLEPTNGRRNLGGLVTNALTDEDFSAQGLLS